VISTCLDADSSTDRRRAPDSGVRFLIESAAREREGSFGSDDLSTTMLLPDENTFEFYN